MNFHLAFLIYPGAILLFAVIRIFNSQITFEEFEKGKYQTYSILISVIIYLLIFVNLKHFRK